MHPLIYIAVFLIGSYALTGLKAQDVLYNMTGELKNVSLELGSTVLDVLQGLSPLIITIDVVNNEDITVTINSFVGSAQMQGYQVSTFDIQINQRIKQHETVTIDIPLVLDYESVLYVIDGYVTDQKIPSLNITGTLSAGGWNYQVNENFDF